MSDATSLVLIIATLGWLALAIGGLRAQRIPVRKALRLVAIWLGIILGLVAILSVLGV